MQPIPADWRSIGLMVASGVGLDEIARQTQININTLKARCRREGWRKQKHQVTEVKSAKLTRAIAAGKMSAPAADGMQVMAAVLESNSKASKLNLSRAVLNASEHAAALAGEEVFAESRHLQEVARTGAVLHDWEAKQQPVNLMVNLALLGVAPESVPIIEAQASN